MSFRRSRQAGQHAATCAGASAATQARGPNRGEFVEALRIVGELVVLKVLTKRIVTSRDLLLGDWGEK